MPMIIAAPPPPFLAGAGVSTAGGFGSGVSLMMGSLLDGHQLLEHLIRGGDGLGIGLECALVRDELHELLRDVDVRLLERAGDERRAPALPDCAERSVTGVVRGDPQVVTCTTEAIVRLELGDGELAGGD